MNGPDVAVFILLCAVALLMSLPSTSAAAFPCAWADVESARHFALTRFSGEASAPPFSFVYGDRPSAEFLETWKV